MLANQGFGALRQWLARLPPESPVRDDPTAVAAKPFGNARVRVGQGRR
jgi:hypothetical protein